jgi:exodeoxyribonuclease VII small subunit
MSDDRSTFEVTRARLEDIVAQVRRKDVSLEQSLDMLEEAVRLVNQCNELIDQTSFKSASSEERDGDAISATGDAPAAEDGEGVVIETVETVEIVDGSVDVVQRIEIVSEPDAGSEEAEGDESAWGSVDAWDEAPTAQTDVDVEDDARE